eukprot:scaffold3305_cov74-Skeletonema_dohrnii-CCMP3373.AAC.4
MKVNPFSRYADWVLPGHSGRDWMMMSVPMDKARGNRTGRDLYRQTAQLECAFLKSHFISKGHCMDSGLHQCSVSTNNAAPAGAVVSEFHQDHSLARETMHDLNSESAYGRERDKATARPPIHQHQHQPLKYTIDIMSHQHQDQECDLGDSIVENRNDSHCLFD